jgi:ABC-type phosphate transport system substrate-binding protein
MTRRPSRARRRVAVGAGLVLALALSLGVAGCSDDGSVDEPGVESLDRARPGPSPASGAAADVDRPAGRVEVDGGPGTLTEAALVAFARLDTGTTVRRGTSGDTRAFQRLCGGEIDIADSTRSLTADEHDQCRRAGLDLVQLRIAADATVLAVGAQTDVGTDCLSTDQLVTGLRAGSEITRWSQLGAGLDDVRFGAGGPTVETPAGRFLGREVLAEPGSTDSDLRADYRGATAEDDTRTFVTGRPADARRAALLPGIEPEYVRLQRAVASARSLYAKAQGRVVAAVEQQRRHVAERRPATVRTRDNQRVATTYADRARMTRKLDTRRALLAPVAKRYRTADAARRRRDATVGRVGLFSQGYYTSHQKHLRPFEIEVSDGDDQPDCVLPSPQTILNGQYPLSRQLLLTVSTAALDRPEVKQVLVYYLNRAQKLAGRAGAVPLPSTEVAQQVAWVQGREPLPEFGVVDGRFQRLPQADAPQSDGHSDGQSDGPSPEPERPAR